jgi:hypothetical protein
VTRGNVTIDDGFFYLSFVAGIAALAWCTGVTITSLSKRAPHYGNLLLLGLLTSLFLCFMTFSFFMWEKYLIIVIPFFAAWVLLARASINRLPP